MKIKKVEPHFCGPFKKRSGLLEVFQMFFTFFSLNPQHKSVFIFCDHTFIFLDNGKVLGMYVFIFILLIIRGSHWFVLRLLFLNLNMIKLSTQNKTQLPLAAPEAFSGLMGKSRLFCPFLPSWPHDRDGRVNLDLSDYLTLFYCLIFLLHRHFKGLFVHVLCFHCYVGINWSWSSFRNAILFNEIYENIFFESNLIYVSG